MVEKKEIYRLGVGVGALISATREAGRTAKLRREKAAKLDAPNNPERNFQQAQRAEVARGVKSYRDERDAEAENAAKQQKAAILQRALEARATREARLRREIK